MTHAKAKDALDTIGTVLTKDEGRDAVHLAVVCCEAGEDINPGQEVCLDKAAEGNPPLVCNASSNKRMPVLGIADPFLKDCVFTGEMFWVFLTPRTITSLTHRWTHPAFPEDQK